MGTIIGITIATIMMMIMIVASAYTNGLIN
jgi:hypothetical protein